MLIPPAAHQAEIARPAALVSTSPIQLQTDVSTVWLAGTALRQHLPRILSALLVQRENTQ
jgi:hypothetical protein